MSIRQPHFGNDIPVAIDPNHPRDDEGKWTKVEPDNIATNRLFVLPFGN